MGMILEKAAALCVCFSREGLILSKPLSCQSEGPSSLLVVFIYLHVHIGTIPLLTRGS